MPKKHAKKLAKTRFNSIFGVILASKTLPKIKKNPIQNDAQKSFKKKSESPQ